jgi:hypothetical protein
VAGRDKNGRFTKGNKAAIGNKGGRPRRATEERYLIELTKVVTLKEWRVIIKKVAEKAKQGDMAAFRLLAEYVIGKPTQYIDADVTSGGEPLAIPQPFEIALKRAYDSTGQLPENGGDGELSAGSDTELPPG